MASSPDNVSMALFCDFENVALGVRDAKYEKFDIKRVLERLLLKGSIVVKKAYCDWERYKGFKAAMHEANFELIEIPHVRQSGKNSADIRLVVDALDLCYTKAHVNTFVIISGDSDFSPLVSKLRENAKQVIGVGVKQSTSDLLIANCDEFIFYDDLVRDSQRAGKRDAREAQPHNRRSPEEERRRREETEARKTQAVEFAVETFEALQSERSDSGKIWASLLKEAMKRRKPDFSESYYGFRAFGNLLEEAKARGLLDFGRDEKSRTFVFRGAGLPAAAEAVVEVPAPVEAAETNAAADSATQTQVEAVATEPAAKPARRRRGEGGRRAARAADEATPAAVTPAVETAAEAEPAPSAPGAPAAATDKADGADAGSAPAPADSEAPAKPERKGGKKGSSRNASKKAQPDAAQEAPKEGKSASKARGRGRAKSEAAEAVAVESAEAGKRAEAAAAPEAASASADGAAAKTARKASSRGRRPKKKDGADAG